MGFISIIQLLKKTDGKAGRVLPALIRVPLLVLQRRWLLTELMEQPICVDQWNENSVTATSLY